MLPPRIKSCLFLHVNLSSCRYILKSLLFFTTLNYTPDCCFYFKKVLLNIFFYFSLCSQFSSSQVLCISQDMYSNFIISQRTARLQHHSFVKNTQVVAVVQMSYRRSSRNLVLFVSLFKKTRLHTRNAYQTTFYKHPFHSLPSLQSPSPLSSKNLVLPVWLPVLSSYGIRLVDLPNLTVSSGRFRKRCKGLKQLMKWGILS